MQLDGKQINENGHDYLMEALDFPDYYGNNLDALYDIMSVYSDAAVLCVKGSSEYGEKVLNTLKEAAKETDRTASACAYRWYSKLSKDSSNACFITISGKHKSLNRKNGEGTKCSQSLFIKILKLLNIIK